MGCSRISVKDPEGLVSGVLSSPICCFWVMPACSRGLCSEAGPWVLAAPQHHDPGPQRTAVWFPPAQPRSEHQSRSLCVLVPSLLSLWPGTCLLSQTRACSVVSSSRRAPWRPISVSCMCGCVYVSMCVCVYVCMCVCEYMCTCVCMHVCM